MESLTALPEHYSQVSLYLPVDAQSIASRRSRRQKREKEKNGPTVLQFEDDDPENPPNFSSAKKTLIVTSGILSVINSTFGSSLPSNAVEFIVKTFGVENELQFVLPISCYLFGYVIGPVLCGPISETYGRKLIFVSTFVVYTLFTMACAVAPNWPSFLFFRFVAGLSASAPIAVVGGIYADIFNEPKKRGLAMAMYMAATAVGPVLAPMISGFIAENVSWRWVFGVGTFFALITLPLVVMIPETYAQLLLTRRAKRIRKKTGEDVVAESELPENQKSTKDIVTVVLTRPFKMLVQELIVACVSLYCSLAYAIFYLNFEAYPLIFQGPTSVYKWSPGLAGLPFISIGIGAVLSFPIFIAWSKKLEKAQKAGEEWTKQEEYRRLPLACLGGPLLVIALFWIGWTSRPDVHWIVPVLSGISFGTGFMLIFMALLNYLGDAYEIFAASAMGITSTCRSLTGALLPLAARTMYGNLGIAWASSTLAFISLGMAVIPFAFIRYGDTIRANSKFCQELKAMKENSSDSSESKGSSQDEEKGNQRPYRDRKDRKKSAMADIKEVPDENKEEKKPSRARKSEGKESKSSDPSKSQSRSKSKPTSKSKSDAKSKSKSRSRSEGRRLEEKNGDKKTRSSKQK